MLPSEAPGDSACSWSLGNLSTTPEGYRHLGLISDGLEVKQRQREAWRSSASKLSIRHWLRERENWAVVWAGEDPPSELREMVDTARGLGYSL